MQSDLIRTALVAGLIHAVAEAFKPNIVIIYGDDIGYGDHFLEWGRRRLYSEW